MNSIYLQKVEKPLTSSVEVKISVYWNNYNEVRKEVSLIM